MKVSLNWLSSIIDLDKSKADFIAQSLTYRGLEVEGVVHQSRGLDKVVVGKIISKEKHPNADKLLLLKVDIKKEVLQIVCGADNMKEGNKVAVALIGADLPNGLLIKKSKIRGVESFGMCCSKVELGLEGDSSGIIILGDDAPLGKGVAGVLSLDDVLIEVTTPPNRGDVLGHLGIAREVAVILGKKLEYKVDKIKATEKGSGGLNVEIKDKRCLRYIGRLIEGVKIKPSPEWLCRRLEAIGLRPINNLVDITNFVMHELGQPLHVFDLRKVSDSKIVVRCAHDGEKMKLLDETQRELTTHDMLIADSKKALAIAGVMGGEDSGVVDSTTDIILECAYFNPATVRVTAKRHGILTDSAYRFERGVDFDFMPKVVDKATALIMELGDAECVFETVDVISHKPDTKPVKISTKSSSDFLGVEIKGDIIKKLLSSTGFKVESVGDSFNITPPSYRNDITIEVDVYEEIARLYGYDNIPAELPSVTLSPDFKVNEDTLKEKSREILKNLGYLETITYSFVPENYHTLLGYDDKDVVRVMNPITETMKVMRVSLVPSLLESVKYNFNHRNMDLKLFEIGRTYLSKGKVTKKLSPTETVALERDSLCCICTGKILDTEDWSREKIEEWDYYLLKGEVTTLLSYLRVPNWDFTKIGENEVSYLHPRVSSAVSCCGKPCGYIGKLHPDLAQEFGLNDNIFLFELCLETLEEVYGTDIYSKDLPRFPSVRRDISFIVSEDVDNLAICSFLKKKKVPNLRDYGVFDLYRGKGIPESRKSMAYYFIFGSDERTLVESEVEDSMDSIVEGFKKEFLIEIR